jgi:hypothetical protein
MFADEKRRAFVPPIASTGTLCAAAKLNQRQPIETSVRHFWTIRRMRPFTKKRAIFERQQMSRSIVAGLSEAGLSEASYNDTKAEESDCNSHFTLGFKFG